MSGAAQTLALVALAAAAGGGGGGGGGAAWDFLPPHAADFTATLGGEAPALVDDVHAGLLLTTANVGDAATIAKVKAIADPDSDWEVIACLNFVIPRQNYLGIGLYLGCTGASGKAIAFKVEQDGTVRPVFLNVPTGWNSNAEDYAMFAADKVWLRIQHIGANLIFSQSVDGRNWMVTTTKSETAWFGAVPDQVGLGFFIQTATGPRPVMTCSYWSDNVS